MFVGLSWVGVSNVDDVNRVFTIGHENRATASTNMNEHSSRSHALLCVEVVGENITTGVKTLGKFSHVPVSHHEGYKCPVSLQHENIFIEFNDLVQICQIQGFMC